MRSSKIIKCIRCENGEASCHKLFTFADRQFKKTTADKYAKYIAYLPCLERLFKLSFFPFTFLVATLNTQLMLDHPFGFSCIFKSLCGFECYGCGMSRAITALWQGKFSESYAYNKFGVLVFLVLAWMSFKELYFLSQSKERT